MRTNTVAAGIVLAITCLATVAGAQEVRECPDGIALLGPGSSVPDGAIPIFRWNGEPEGTASRQVVVIASAENQAQQVGAAGPFRGSFQLAEGEYVWFVTFRNAAGSPICRTPVAALEVGGRIRIAGSSGLTSGDGSSFRGPMKITLNGDGRYVVVLRDSPYTGNYSERVDSDDYNGSAFNLAGIGATGLEIHGSNVRNVVTGSSGSDLIILYDGNDEANGGPGDDTLHGGRGSDTITDTAGIDTVYAGPGNDVTDTDDTPDDNDTVYGGGDADTMTADAAEIDGADGPEGIL